MSWRLARSIVQLQRELDVRWPDRVKPDWTIGDADHKGRPSDHNPNEVGVVTAIDVRSHMAELADLLIRSKDPRIKYVIFDGRIFSSTVAPWRWRPYVGSNPHRTHLHLSVDGPYDDVSPWGIGDDMALSDEDLGKIREVVRSEIATTESLSRQVLKAVGFHGGKIRRGVRALLGLVGIKVHDGP